MKVLRVLITSTLLAFILISCGSTNVETKTETIQQAPKVQKEDSPADKFIKSLEGISLSFVSSPKATNVNKAFSSDFKFIVKDANGNPLADYPVTISYPSGKTDGEIIYNEIDIKTDANGTYSYKAEVPSFSADTTLAVYPTPIDNSDKVIDAAVSYCAEADWKVKSDIISKGAVLFIWDFNEKGAALLFKNETKRQSYFTTISSDKKTPNEKSFDNSEVKCIKFAGNNVLVMNKDGINRYGFKGSDETNINSETSYDRFILIDDYIFLMGYDRIDRVKYSE